MLHNVASCFIFVLIIFLNRRGYHYTALTMAIAEFVSHAGFAVSHLGWGTGYQNYLFFLAITLYLAPSGRRAYKAVVVALVAAGYLSLYYYSTAFEPPMRVPQLYLNAMYGANAAGIFFLLALMAYYYRNAADTAEEALTVEHKRSEDLLHNILPVEIADRLKVSPGIIAERFDSCSVLFADIVGFTEMADRMDAPELVSLLDGIFSMFDDIAGKFGLEKIKTIGDSYMAASGIPAPRPDHAEAAASAALEMMRVMKGFNRERGASIALRIGINSGPVVAGVIGKKKFTYDLWGDSVNMASRMEYHGIAGEIQVTEATRRLLEAKYRFTQRESIIVKGKGEMQTYILSGEL